MSETITITINGQQIETAPGQMLIDVADAHRITIPRFCYHKKLSVAANCRMCLVDIEKAPKPMPACATPVNDGMVVNTRSQKAIAAQKSTMEFLLINHPLDCPICDQGGECELQDVAMGFGGDVSQYTESKRVIRDKNIGPLISTDLTRCILCTRCVRFGEEIAGLPELGATGRGEMTQIGTYIEHALTSELSGNVIDVCPVGALTAKPSRYQARPWELVQHATIAAHDCVGSNLYVHSRGNVVIRVVPRENEAVNECWISDRDRFSYTALYHQQRCVKPKIRKDGKLVETDWETALQTAVDQLQQAGNAEGDLAALVSAQCTLEEQFLLQKLLRGLGSQHIDHRFKLADFSTQDQFPLMPWLGTSIESLQRLDAALLIGSDLRQQQPMLNHRLHTAVRENNAKIASIDSLNGQFNYELIADIAASPALQVHELAGVVKALGKLLDKPLQEKIASLVEKVKPTDQHKLIASSLNDAAQAAVIIGSPAASQSDYSLLLMLAEQAASLSGAYFGILSESVNSAGACIAGCLPHRGVAGETLDKPGQHTAEILQSKHKLLLMMNFDPSLDVANSEQPQQLAQNNDFVIAINSYDNEFCNQHADLVLPLSSSFETSGTFVNIEGFWQSFSAVIPATGESRPGWKILSALSRLLFPGDKEYAASTELRDELRDNCRDLELNNFVGFEAATAKLPAKPRSLQCVSAPLIYATDAMLRHAAPLQQTTAMQLANKVRLNAVTAEKQGVNEAQQVLVRVAEQTAVLEVAIDDSVADNCVWLAQNCEATASLVVPGAKVELESLS